MGNHSFDEFDEFDEFEGFEVSQNDIPGIGLISLMSESPLM